MENNEVDAVSLAIAAVKYAADCRTETKNRCLNIIPCSLVHNNAERIKDFFILKQMNNFECIHLRGYMLFPAIYT